MYRRPRLSNQFEVPYVEANLDIWIQLGEVSWQANATLLEMVQQLRIEMINLSSNHECMRQEKEKILKNLSDQ